MKYSSIPTLFIILMAFACSDNDPEPKGCMTGVSKVTGSRIILKCSTKKEFQSHDFIYWDDYTDHNWELCDSCK